MKKREHTEAVALPGNVTFDLLRHWQGHGSTLTLLIASYFSGGGGMVLLKSGQRKDQPRASPCRPLALGPDHTGREHCPYSLKFAQKYGRLVAKLTHLTTCSECLQAPQWSKRLFFPMSTDTWSQGIWPAQVHPMSIFWMSVHISTS